MKITIDTGSRSISLDEEKSSKEIDLYSDQAFELLSRLWVKVGWNQKYQYTFSWLGRPIIQLPDDLIRIQEAIFSLKPDYIIETGVAHGGSLIFYATLCHALERGQVIGIDIEIRDHNRTEIEQHSLSRYITLIENDSASETVVSEIRNKITPSDRVLVVLDSNHSYEHVMTELELYSTLVTPGSFIIATDGIMEDLSDTPRGVKTWEVDNPAQAARDFCNKNQEFEIVEPKWPFNESELRKPITHWPSAWIMKKL